MTHRILFLPTDPAAAATCLDVDDAGRVLARAALAPGATASPATAGRCVLVVPGDAVRIDRIPLRAHSAAQARAAARALLAERLARPAHLHVAIDGDHAAAIRTVASVEPALLRDWLARAEAFGLRPDAIVPEPLLLPPPAGESDGEGGLAAVQVLDAGERWLVRGPSLVFAAPPALAAQVLGDAPRVLLEDGIEDLVARALRPEVDLLQDAFAPEAARGRPPARRRLAWLAALLLASPLLLVAAQALRLELAARALEARAEAAVPAALPHAADAAPQAEGADALARQLQAAHEPRAFASAAGALFAAVAARPGTHLVELDYARGDRLRALLFHAGADDLEALRGALAAEGWTLVEGGSLVVPGGLHTGLVLESTT